MMPIGMIGLGNMGFPIAVNLLKKSGRSVYGFDVVDSALDRFAELGGTACHTSEEVFRACDTVFFSLPGNSLVQQNLQLAIELCPEGAVLVDTSSTVPAVIKSCVEAASARHIRLIDCPVSGGVSGAEDGTLSAMCGGAEDDVQSVMPLLKMFCAQVTHMGHLGCGYTTKLINNLIVGGEITLLAEAFGLARRAGLDLSLLYNAIRNGAAGSCVLDIKGPKMISADYTPSSRVAIHLKDQHNAQELARSLEAETPACDISTALLEKLVSLGRGNDDIAAVVSLFDKQN